MLKVFHGTSRSNAESILRDGAFNDKTQWTHDFLSALAFGGHYVFLYDHPTKKETDYWEWFDTPPLEECSLIRVSVEFVSGKKERVIDILDKEAPHA